MSTIDITNDGCSIHGPFDVCGHTDHLCPDRATGEKEGGEIETKEINDNEYLKMSRVVGDCYVNFINSLSGNTTLDDVWLETLSSKIQMRFKEYIASTKKYQRIYESRISTERLSATDLLMQAFPKETVDNLTTDKSGPPYRIEKLNQGIYGVFIEHEAYQKLFAGDKNPSQAKAVKIKGENAVSFVIIREPLGKDDARDREYLAENIPHEINHLVGFFAENEGHLFTDETNPNIRKGFMIYREELLSRLSTNGGIMGYDHIRPGKSERDELEQEDPQTLKIIDDYSSALFDLCVELNELVGTHEEEVHKKDLLMAVMEAKNYEQLVTNLKRMKKIAEERKIIQPNPFGAGWAV